MAEGLPTNLQVRRRHQEQDMTQGLFDDAPLINLERDKAWDAGFNAGWESHEEFKKVKK